MTNEANFGDLNDIIKEFLKFNNYKSTYECFEAEEKTKMVAEKLSRSQINIIPKVILNYYRTLMKTLFLGFTDFGKQASQKLLERRY